MTLSGEALESLYSTMVRIRRFDERTVELFNQGLVKGTAHSYVGQEAVAAGACAALEDGDSIVGNHRGHGHCIAKGADVRRMMAELFGRVDGYCKGKGGSMHIADFGVGMLGANGIVAGGISIVTGAGLAAQMEGKKRVAVSFFGDGASNAGPFHESLNIAASWKLPMIYVCENNLYAAQTSAAETHAMKDVAAAGKVRWDIVLKADAERGNARTWQNLQNVVRKALATVEEAIPRTAPPAIRATSNVP